MKKIISLMLSIVLIFSITSSVFAQNATTQEQQIKTIFYNGYEKKAENAYIVEKNNKRYLPLRPVFEALGYEVSWDNEQQLMIVDRYGLKMIYQAGSEKIYAANSEIDLVDAPIKMNERMYMEYHALMETLDVEVLWNSQLNKLLLFQKQGKGFFWKVEHEDNIVYLLGSVHAGDDSMYPIRDVIEKSFHESDYAVFEVKLDASPSEEDTKKIEALYVYTDGTTLKDHIPAATYQNVQAVLVGMGLPLDSFDQLQPWVVGQQLEGLLSEAHHYSPLLGIDNYFAGRAVLEEKPISGLETYLLQYEAFASFSEDYVLAQINTYSDMLIKRANGEEVNVPNTLQALIDMWRNGDTKQLEQLAEDTADYSPEFYEKLIVNRHSSMLEQLEQFLNSEGNATYFVVVGALHTLGKDGLVKLLSDKGYVVISYQ